MTRPGNTECGVRTGWWICEAAYEAEVVRRYGLWLPCHCPVSRLGYFHWVRSDGPAVGLWVMELSRGLPQNASFLQTAAWRVLTGYGHALSPSLAVGDVLMATAVFDESGLETLETLWPDPVPGVELGGGVVAAPVLVTSRIPETPRRRQALYRQTGAWVLRPNGHWREVVRGLGGVGLLLWVMDTAQERASPDDPVWRLQRHRTILERQGDRIERALWKVTGWLPIAAPRTMDYRPRTMDHRPQTIDLWMSDGRILTGSGGCPILEGTVS